MQKIEEKYAFFLITFTLRIENLMNHEFSEHAILISVVREAKKLKEQVHDIIVRLFKKSDLYVSYRLYYLLALRFILA